MTEQEERWTIGHFMWRDKSRPETKCRGVLAGPEIPGDQLEVVPLSRALTAESRVQELEAERGAIIDAINIYGGRVLHKALDDAGLALTPSTPSSTEER